MSLSNFHTNGNIQDSDLLIRSSGFLEKLQASFRQQAANGNFNFGIINLGDADMNRVHSIVTEIDSRRVFYTCSDDEIPSYAMKSMYEVRESIRGEAKGVWADPSCEAIIQEIQFALGEACSEAEKHIPNVQYMSDPGFEDFINIITNMRLKVWGLVALLKLKLGSVINPRNLPPEIEAQAKQYEL